MANLFRITRLGRIGKYVCLLLTVSFIYCTASGTGHYVTAKHSTYSLHYDFSAIVPQIIMVPEPTSVDYSYPKNDRKPINIDYQVIKHRSLGLINAQMNI